MKLVEILAKELWEWPHDSGLTICQDYDGEVGIWRIANPRVTNRGDTSVVWHSRGHITNINRLSCIATDHATAIVTRADWESERARIAKPAKNADKEGWIRHRAGRKCPVEEGVRVDYRMRSKKEAYGERAELLDWGLDNECPEIDIMAYRLHKPAEHVEACSKPELRSLPENYGEIIGGSVEGPIQWRDRITEIDATTQALTTERAELVQKLAGEGLALIGRVAEPVEDYGNIQIGDLVSVIGIGGFSDCTGLSVGDIVEVTSVDNDESLKTVSGGSWGSIGYNYKFHSRPSA